MTSYRAQLQARFGHLPLEVDDLFPAGRLDGCPANLAGHRQAPGRGAGGADRGGAVSPGCPAR